MLSKKRFEETILNMYREMYRESSPSADFDKLMEESERDRLGRRMIQFDKYYLNEARYKEIVDKYLKTKGLSPLQRRHLSFEAYLGCGPSTSIKSLIL